MHKRARWMLLASLLLASTVTAVEFDHSHAAWSRLLGEHVRDGHVDYSGLASKRPELQGYLTQLEQVTAASYAGWSEAQRLAFWINAYNAYTVELILDHWPVRSIKDIGKLWQSPFKLDFIALDGLRADATSLDAIEHSILRQDFSEPRIHFAIVCASLSCPPLVAEAYVAERLDAQLELRTRSFLGDRRYNRYHAESNTLQLSKLFDWFREDFEHADGSVLGFVRKHAPEPLGRALATAPEPPRIRHLDYDWSLNGS